jgi:hypothetical protein
MSFTGEQSAEREFEVRAAALRKDLNLPPKPERVYQPRSSDPEDAAIADKLNEGVDPEEIRRKARIEALRKDVDESERRIIRGAGTAYPVDSEKHQWKADAPASGLPGIPIGPINLPKLDLDTEFTLALTPTMIVGMIQRQLAVMQKAAILEPFIGMNPTIAAYSDEGGVLIRVTFQQKLNE